MPPTPQRRSPQIPESPQRGVRLQRTDSLLQSKVLYTSPAALSKQDISVQFQFDRHFKDWKKVGVGSFGEVFRAQSVSNGKIYAIKRSRRAFNGRADRETYLREITSVCSLGEHPNIVKYYRAWQENQHFYLQLELCEGGTLQGVLDHLHSPIPPEQMKQFWCQMSSGLAHIHAHEMLHLDLKPENIFMVGDPNQQENYTLKIGDFGTAVTLGQWDDEDGDPMYLAPELLRGEAGPPADVFSLGLIFYEMITGAEMPGGGSEWQRLRSGNVALPQSACDWQGILLDMIKPEPRSRPEARHILTCLETGKKLLDLTPSELAAPPPARSDTALPEPHLLGGRHEMAFSIPHVDLGDTRELEELNEGFSRSMSLSPLRGGFTSSEEDSDEDML